MRPARKATGADCGFYSYNKNTNRPLDDLDLAAFVASQVEAFSA